MQVRFLPPSLVRMLLLLFLLSPGVPAQQQTHDHPAPENLGTVSFPTSCKPEVQQEFERGVALLHSFAYSVAETWFKQVAEKDPSCAIAHWGIAMTHFHQLWDPPIRPDTIPRGRAEIRRAREIHGSTDRERRLVDALAIFYDADLDAIRYSDRVSKYEHAMGELAAAYPNDEESQVFYALALLASASPLDTTHANQQRALRILDPLFRAYPRHPGISHYLIHACDNPGMAERGLVAARAYSKIAPSAPHALHMPSHIFTRLGMWDDSIASNLAAQAAAHNQGDIGEELHAMDYLVYAYLQRGREREAAGVVQRLKAMTNLDAGDFKIAYAATAMPVRYAVERHRWDEAAAIVPTNGTPLHVTAVAVWARGLGLARSGRPAEARREASSLRGFEGQLRGRENGEYWARQVGIQVLEVNAWSAQAEGKADEAGNLLRKAADDEDAIEKLPITPGPIIPAREQLADLLLEQKQPALALKEFQLDSINAPKRRGALVGISQASKALESGDPYRPRF